VQFAGGSAKWVGRIQELAVLRAAVEALRRGEGSVVWVEGEPGIGKSSLVAEALTESDPGWDIGWGNADQLTEHLPLRVMLECLQIRPGSPDKRRAQAAGLLHSQRQGLFGDGDDALAVGVELLLAVTAAIRAGRTCYQALTREIAKYRIIVDRNRHRARKSKSPSSFGRATAKDTRTRIAPAAITMANAPA
jgi:AAA ATPase domain